LYLNAVEGDPVLRGEGNEGKEKKVAIGTSVEGNWEGRGLWGGVFLALNSDCKGEEAPRKSRGKGFMYLREQGAPASSSRRKKRLGEKKMQTYRSIR